jgi:hypothetical protein
MLGAHLKALGAQQTIRVRCCLHTAQMRDARCGTVLRDSGTLHTSIVGQPAVGTAILVALGGSIQSANKVQTCPTPLGSMAMSAR